MAPDTVALPVPLPLRASTIVVLEFHLGPCRWMLFVIGEICSHGFLRVFLVFVVFGEWNETLQLSHYRRDCRV